MASKSSSSIWRRWLHTKELWIFLLLLISYTYFFPRWAEWNQNSRMALTMALVEQHTIVIDDYYHYTGDYAAYDGHFYTDKAPGTSFLGVVPYAVYYGVMQLPPVSAFIERASHNPALAATLRDDGSGLLAEKIHFAGALYFVTFFAVSLPSALLGVALYRFLRRLIGDHLLTAALVVTYGLGTVAFPYSTVFYGHQIGAILLFFAFTLLYRIRRTEISDNYLWLGGALVGLMVLVEFPSLIAGGFLGLYALVTLRNKVNIYRFVLAGLPFAVILGLYNASAFGSPFTSSYKYLVTFSEISATGMVGFTQPSWEAFWGITFSPYRGLFFYSPFVLLALPGFWQFARRRDERAEFWLILAIVVSQFILISSWFDWRGGFAIGPRNLLLTLPLMMIPTAMGGRWLVNKGPAGLLVWLLMGASLMVMGVASVSGQEFPPITVAHPLVEYWWPRFLAGDITRNLGMVFRLPAWFSLIPWLVIVGGVFLWMQFAKPFRSQPPA